MQPGGRFQFEFVAPPGDVADLVNSFFILHTDEKRIEEVMPAYSAQMYVLAGGSAEMVFATGNAGRAEGAYFTAPMHRAAGLAVNGPATCAGASLTALGWAAISGLPVDEVHDRILPPGDVLEPPHAGRMAALAGPMERGEIDPQAVCAELAAVLRAARRNLPAGHARFIGYMTRWLTSAFSPSLETLYRDAPLSKRQVQRLSKRYFGKPPSGTLKRFRAIRAATLLANPDLPDELRDEILSAYFDQAHMIRDLRQYTGRTPTRLGDRTLAVETLQPEGHGPTARFLWPSDPDR